MTKPLAGLQILIVDDEIVLREIFSSILYSEGANVLTACDGLEAIETLRTTHIHIVLTDIQMPNCDGIELLALINKLKEQKPFVIVMTGHTDVPTRTILQSGAKAVLSKPFLYQELMDEIKSLQGRIAA